MNSTWGTLNPRPARRLQIIHTNDLHSMFAGTHGRGGYAQLKHVLQRLVLEGKRQGIDSLILDGGDFSEGSSFFLVDRGIDTFRALDLLGHEAAVLGNHDHMMGDEVLSDQIEQAELRARILSANAVFASSSDARNLVRPYAIFRKGGLRIIVIGLSTPELYYQYSLRPGYILPPLLVIGHYERIARQEGADLVVALTHLGLAADRRLVQHTTRVDLVVGGHSHSFLEEPVEVRNRDGRRVPIVQAGAHGFAVGRLIVEAREPGEILIRDYGLYPVNMASPEDPEVWAFVERAVERRHTYFHGRWDQVVGGSRISLYGYSHEGASGKEYWIEQQARMVREAAETDIGVHIGNFNGIMVPPGEITYGNIVDNMPHVRRFGEHGWQLGRSNLEGWRLLAILKAFINLSGQLAFRFDGLKWRQAVIPDWVPLVGGWLWLWDVRVGGQPLKRHRHYSLGFTSEIARAARELLPSVEQVLFPQFEKMDHRYWQVTENYIRQHSPLERP